MTTDLSRRQLLRVLGLLGLTSSAGIIGACQQASPGGSAQPAASPASGPKVGGDLRFDVLADPLSLDPLRFNAVEGQRVYRLTNSQLLKYREDKAFDPDLAAALPTVSSDRLTYTFKLKTNVKWHDGKPFDSSDVKFTFDNALNPQNASEFFTALSSVRSVEAPDPQTIIVQLKAPFTPIMHKFALLPIISSKIPYEQNKTYASTLVGTGPYKFVEWQKGVQVVLERNPEYFVSGKPYIQKVTFRTVQENATRTTNLVNNQTQIVPEVPVNQIDLLKQRGANVVTLQDSTTRVFAYPSFQQGRPTGDINMRLAIAWAIDRQQIVDQVFNGTAVPASTYLSSGSLYFDQRLGTFFGNRPDLTKAKDYLQKAGGPPNRDLDFVVQNLPDLVDVATIIQSNLKAIGINVKISAQEIGGFFQKLIDGDFDLLMIRVPAGTTAGYAPDYVRLGLLSGSPSNYSKFADSRMDELLQRAVEAPESEAQAAWRAVQERDLETLGQIQFVTTRYVEAYSKSLQGYKPSALAMPYGLPDAWIG